MQSPGCTSEVLVLGNLPFRLSSAARGVPAWSTCSCQAADQRTWFRYFILSKKKVARERNGRATSSLVRMSKLHGMPGSLFRKNHVLISGFFPHALHAAELVPKTVLQRLRSGAARAIGARPKGASPWLSCLLASYRRVDPKYVLVIGRI